MNLKIRFVFQRFIIVVVTLFLCIQTATALSAKINGFRMWASPDSTRLVIDLSKSVNHRLNYLSNPERLVLDIDKIKLKSSVAELSYEKGAIANIQAIDKGNKVRLVMELKYKIKPQSFLLKPNKKYGYRLVIDLNEIKKTSQTSMAKIIKSVNSTRKRDIIVAIDAGHGGEDPGAIGPKGTQEKKISLEIARKLERLVNNKPGMRAVMIRDGDYYISLRGRTKKARRLGADIFISIHADAFKNPKAHGSSVFILSSRGASSEAAKWLAKKENDADLMGGVSLDDKGDMLARVLLDLSQTACIDASNNAASGVISELSKIGDTHKRKVERAGFAVLKSPDIPSLLIETGFISNPKEERLLKTSGYQNKIAHAILQGVNGYFKQYPMLGTIYSKDVVVKPLSQSIVTASNQYNHQMNQNNKRHRVAPGDTLSAISRRYAVSVASLKQYNSMKNNRLYVGKTIRIPRS
ncbi:MAG: N-acetylmuramoyl-L-alanine amidase [Gammaproteobacteria bacterium]|nr:N-acetylmuramoyl-L-alanine amidase [Gammaproteobacteria bacterium]